MKKYRGAVFFDIDGTLIPIRDRMTEEERKKLGTRHLSVPQSAKDAIKKLNENGYLTAIASGRSEDYMYDLGIDISCVISANGSVVRIDGKTVHTDVIEHSTATELTKYFTDNSLNYLIETEQGCFLGEGTDSDFVWAGKNYPPVSEYKGERVEIGKIISYYDGRILEECEKRFGDKMVFLPHRYDTYMDINQKGTSKASGIKKVLEIYGIDIADSYAFGDDLNDTEMLSAVGHAVVMTPHAAELEKVAEFITDSVENDGIYKGLLHFGLI